MKTRAIRLYGVDDIRLEEFDLPEIADDEILVKVVSDSICMSTWKTVKQGAKHKRVPDDVHENPVIIGHEFAGDIVKVGSKWQDKFQPGQKFAQQPAIPGQMESPGYSYKWCGGIRNTAYSPMTSLKRAVCGRTTVTRISPVPWQSLCPAASAGITRITTRSLAAMNTSWAQRKTAIF